MSDCATGETPVAASIVVHVVAEAAALDDPSAPDLNGERRGDGGPEIVCDAKRFAELIREATSPRPIPRPTAPVHNPTPNPGVVLGGPVIPAEILADLARRGAVQLRPLIHPGDSAPEPRYRRSMALADFVRCRDVTCRFPGCDRPADLSDIDHTIPYDAGGLTHASNLKCLCRKQHLLKTFYGGPHGWRDRQEPDGTVTRLGYPLKVPVGGASAVAPSVPIRHGTGSGNLSHQSVGSGPGSAAWSTWTM